MPRKNQGWVTFQATPEERQLLDAYCQRTQRSKTEVLRELIRTLDASEPTPSRAVTRNSFREAEPDSVSDAAMRRLVPFQVSARNLLRGTILHLHQDGVNTEIILEIAPTVEMTAVITTTSAQRLGLQVGMEVYAMIKSSNVMIAVSGVSTSVVEGLLA